MEFITLYLLVGVLYSFYLMYEAQTSGRSNRREHWVGILIIATLFWPIDMVVGNVGYINRKENMKLD
jgi:uncharacterized membrane protein YhaH (DUF805 family)